MKKSELKALIREVIEEATTNSPISYPEAIDLLAKEEAQRYINSGNSKRMNISDDAMSVVELLFGKTKQEIGGEIENEANVIAGIVMKKFIKNILTKEDKQHLGLGNYGT